MSRTTKHVEKVTLTPAQINATINAIEFVLADDWDEHSHEHAPEVYERAATALRSLQGKVVTSSLRSALDAANEAYRASDTLARQYERERAGLFARIRELEEDLYRAEQKKLHGDEVAS